MPAEMAIESGPVEMKQLSYGIRDAAGLLGISERGLWGLIYDGEVKPIRIGRRVLVDVDELRAFIARRKAAAQA